MEEINHTVEKPKKEAKEVEFEDDRHIELKTELMWQVDKAGALIKEKDGLINQLKKKCRTLKKRSIKVKPAVAKQCKT